MADEWAGILSEGEEILWQGEPKPHFSFEDVEWPGLIMGVLFTAFSLFWMSKAMQAGGFFWMFGLIFLVLGIRQILNAISEDALSLRNTYYSLSNQRAFIATESRFRGRRLKSYPITPDAPLELVLDSDGERGSIFFAKSQVTPMRREGDHYVYTHRGTRTPRSIGFKHIDDVQKVYGLMSKIQRSAQ